MLGSGTALAKHLAMRPLDILMTTMALALGLSACADMETMASEQGEHADEGFDIIDINLGESLTGLSVERLRVNVEQASKAEINRSTVSLRLHLLAGQTASIAMLAEDDTLDSYLLVKDLQSGETVTKCDDQVFVPHADAQDSVVLLRAEQEQDFLIIATGGADMHTAGRFRIDSIAHDDPHVDLSATGAGLEAVTAHLRSRESSLLEWFALAAMEEGDDGLLKAVDGALREIPLRRRVEFNNVMRSVNEDRETLFDELIRRSGDEQASHDSVGQALAAIYQVTRD
jgi:hypothetical protein